MAVLVAVGLEEAEGWNDDLDLRADRAECAGSVAGDGGVGEGGSGEKDVGGDIGADLSPGAGVGGEDVSRDSGVIVCRRTDCSLRGVAHVDDNGGHLVHAVVDARDDRGGRDQE